MHVTKDEMIESQLKGRGINDKRVLQAMQEIDRKDFVPEDLKPHAYEDSPLPIGRGQTISQPYIVAFMAQALKLSPEDVVLEIGSGCGYNAAVLSKLARHIYSIEIVEWLADFAQKNIEKSGIQNVSIRYGDGYKGWPEKAPFDAIMLTAAPPALPEPLKDQLKIGGYLLAPVGTRIQKLKILKREEEDFFTDKTLLPVSFVPMTGEAQFNT